MTKRRKSLAKKLGIDISKFKPGDRIGVFSPLESRSALREDSPIGHWQTVTTYRIGPRGGLVRLSYRKYWMGL